jgi:hypothetical protein
MIHSFLRVATAIAARRERYVGKYFHTVEGRRAREARARCDANAILRRMNVAASPDECAQRLNTIYAWSRLLELRSADVAFIAQAIQAIQHNAEQLLRRIERTPEVP